MLIQNPKLNDGIMYWSAGYDHARDASIVTEANRSLWSNINVGVGIGAFAVTLVGFGLGMSGTVPWLIAVLATAALWAMFYLLVTKNGKRQTAHDELVANHSVYNNVDKWDNALSKSAWAIFADTLYPMWTKRHPVPHSDHHYLVRAGKKDFIRMLSEHSLEVNQFLQDPAVKASVEYINGKRPHQTSKDEAEFALMLYAEQIGEGIFAHEDLQEEQQALVMQGVGESITQSADLNRELSA